MARYFLRFRHSDTGLTPTFSFFKKASDLTNVTPPPILEVQNGTYYFDYTPTFDIIFEVDGGASIPTEEVRYISDTISPKDTYIDGAISNVKNEVWDLTMTGHTNAGTFGRAVSDTSTHVLQLRRINEGRWKIFTSGPDANRLVLYSNDGTTVLQKWDLKDAAGSPATTNIFERIPTESIP
jgi:hypothetical protein